MKKGILFLIIILGLTIFTGCNSNDNNIEENNESKKASIEKLDITLVDNEIINIKANGISNEYDNVELLLTIENKMEKPIDLEVDNVAVGDTMEDTVFYSEILGKKKSEETITFDNLYDIKDIKGKVVEGTFTVYGTFEDYNFDFKEKID